MTQSQSCVEFDLLDDEEAFFAPTSSDAIDALMGQFEHELSLLESAASIASGDAFKSSMFYFLDGNTDKDSRSSMSHLTDRLFNPQGAIMSLTELYWRKAIGLTNVYDFMPQKRRDEWETTLTSWRSNHYKRGVDVKNQLPSFEAATVRSSLYSLLDMRPQFLAEKVDGVFSKLSIEHLTNQPEGFSKRLIMWYSYNTYGISADYQKCGYLNDLRSVISKFMGNDEIPHYSTSQMVNDLINRDRFGEWVSLDGNALRIKIFRKGTAHVEIHPDIAYRLNMILSQLHPLAIPSEFRQKPDRKTAKNFGLMQRPLADAVLRAILTIVGLTTNAKERNRREFRLPLHWKDISKFAVDEAVSVLERLGGVLTNDTFSFDYDIQALVGDEIYYSRCVPETKSHQFYPTPKELAMTLSEMASVRPGESVLEPSAGVGGLIDHLAPEVRSNVTCVEVAKLHCEVLRNKGFTEVICDDFLKFASTTKKRWDCILMNPPFSEGRAMEHLKAAQGLLKEGGRLVAIMPSGARNKVVEAGFLVSYSDTLHHAFPGVGVSVVIVTIYKESMAMAA